MAVNVQSIVVDASDQLNDQAIGLAFIRWPVDRLIEYLNGALRQVAMLRPDLFTQKVTLALVPGSMQALPSSVSKLVSVDQNVSLNPACGIGSFITRGDYGVFKSFNRASGCFPSNYEVNSYYYDPSQIRNFYVSPSVPPNKSYSVIATCILNPPEYTIVDYNAAQPIVVNGVELDRQYYNALLAWMMHKAYEVDTESATSYQLMRHHLKHFYDMMGVDYRQDSRLGSGYHLGRVSTDGGDKVVERPR